jgi:glutaredoxin
VEVDTRRFEARPARTPAAAAPAPRAPARRPLSRAGSGEPERRAMHDVTVYTAPWCGWCRKTLAFLDQRGVDYVNKDIEEDPEHAAELIEKSGGKSIPFVEIDGAQIHGYNPGRMTALLR